MTLKTFLSTNASCFQDANIAIKTSRLSKCRRSAKTAFFAFISCSYMDNKKGKVSAKAWSFSAEDVSELNLPQHNFCRGSNWFSAVCSFLQTVLNSSNDEDNFSELLINSHNKRSFSSALNFFAGARREDDSAWSWSLFSLITGWEEFEKNLLEYIKRSRSLTTFSRVSADLMFKTLHLWVRFQTSTHKSDTRRSNA